MAFDVWTMLALQADNTMLNIIFKSKLSNFKFLQSSAVCKTLHASLSKFIRRRSNNNIVIQCVPKIEGGRGVKVRYMQLINEAISANSLRWYTFAHST